MTTVSRHIAEFRNTTMTDIRVERETSPFDTNDAIVFTTSTGEQYRMTHLQDCCETVTIDDIVGNLDDLVGSPMTMAEVAQTGDCRTYDESCTWTFYKLATAKGYVTIRWYGASNGYYSESVDIVCVPMSDGTS